MKSLSGLWGSIGELLSPPLNGVHDKVFSSGDKYSGAFVNGLREGFGIYVGTHFRYEGEWLHDKRHGRGRQEFLREKVCKKGKRKVVSAGVYDGEWALDKKHGTGRFEYENGDSYFGEWHGGAKHGHGSYVFRNGDRFDGEFKENMMHGKGIFLEGKTKDQIIGAPMQCEPRGY